MPVWWNKRCWLAGVGLPWSVAFTFISWGDWSSGFNAALILYWVYYLVDQRAQYYTDRLLDIMRNSIELQAETISIQHKHINYLKGQR